MKPSHARITTLAAAAAVAAGATALLCSHLVLNVTDSLPHGLYWLAPGPQVQRGQLVAVRVPDAVRGLMRTRGYGPADGYLLKHVAAVEGDEVCTEGGTVRVRGEVLGPQRSTDSLGRPLPRYEACGPLPHGAVFLAAAHERSFDSRVFGPVASADVVAQVVPLWTW